MAILRIPESIAERARNHLFSKAGEHFVFFLARPAVAAEGPLFLIEDLILVPDEAVEVDAHGYGVAVAALVAAVNAAVRRGLSLVEGHNHGGARPRFSPVDRRGLQEFVPYVLDSLPGRPYAATVWGDEEIYGEYFTTSATARLRSIVSYGPRLRQLVSKDSSHEPGARYARQTPWFTEAGQRQLGSLRVAIAGLGGTGSHVAQQLAYLGIRSFGLVDPDVVDLTNLNRLVGAILADLDTPKVHVVRRLIKQIAPEAMVTAVRSRVQLPDALDALKTADVIFGCVDNDGARLVLNELALAFRVPYFDLASGLDAENSEVTGGGRLSFVNSDGPCLACAGDIDLDEARHHLDPPVLQDQRRRAGYVAGLEVPAPAVVSVNGLVASIAVNELAMFVSGTRPVPAKIDFDLVGQGRGAVAGQWVTPVRVRRRPGCVECAKAGDGDGTRLDRFHEASSSP
jgi:molybdopterin/thiamine biosynthesis adenylyltransferase